MHVGYTAGSLRRDPRLRTRGGGEYQWENSGADQPDGIRVRIRGQIESGNDSWHR